MTETQFKKILLLLNVNIGWAKFTPQRLDEPECINFMGVGVKGGIEGKIYSFYINAAGSYGYYFYLNEKRIVNIEQEQGKAIETKINILSRAITDDEEQRKRKDESDFLVRVLGE